MCFIDFVVIQIKLKEYEKEILSYFLGCLVTLPCFAGSIQELDGKMYISPGSVYVAPDAIYVNIEGNFVSVAGIASDSHGVYIQNHECAPNKFYCMKCGKYHSLDEGCNAGKK